MTEVSRDTIWQDDLLDRKGDAEFLEDFLVNRMTERNANSRAFSVNAVSAQFFAKSASLTARSADSNALRDAFCADVPTASSGLANSEPNVDALPT